jgi:hypothetical protein
MEELIIANKIPNAAELLNRRNFIGFHANKEESGKHIVESQCLFKTTSLVVMTGLH